MKTGILLLIFLAATAGVVDAQTTRPLNNQSPAAFTVTTIANSRGWRFTVNGNGVTVTELGCWHPDSSTQSKLLILWSTTPTWTILAQVNSVPGPGWCFTQLPTPVPLAHGSEYCVSAYSATNMYSNTAPPASWKPAGVINYVATAWANTPATPTTAPTGSPNTYQYQQGVADIGYVTGPQLAVSAPAGATQNVYNNETGAGGNGVHCGTFTIASNSQAGGVLNTISITASGSGNDQTGFSHVAVHRDSNNTTAFEPGGDTLIGVAATGFPANDGTLSFTVQAAEQNFGTTETRRYFVVVKLAGTAAPGNVFNFAVSDITVSGPSATKSGLPSAVMNGLTILGPVFAFADASPGAPVTAYLGSSGNVCQEFTIGYPAGPDNKPGSVTVSGSGTGNESSHVTGVGLWHDANVSGDFESGSDVLVSSGTFSADNGTITFSLASQPDFQAAQTRTYFVIYNFNQAALHDQTFKCFVSAAAGAQLGAVYSGLPCPGVGGTPGLTISTVVLNATFNGPGSATAVPNNAAGPTGEGHLLCDVTLQALDGGPWNLGGLSFAGSGTAAMDTAFSELGLYQDGGNGVWDGSLNDPVAAATITGFGSGPGHDATFILTNDLLPASGSRRFYLVGKLNGGATSGQTLNARFVGITGAPPAGGIQNGMPTVDSTALVIAPAAVTVSNGPAALGAIEHRAGTALTLAMARFRFSASNDAVSINGLTLVTTGTGDWTAAVDSVNGLEVYRDNGDGVFAAGVDTKLAQDGGGAQAQMTLVPALVVPNNGHADLWVVANVLATAGAGSVAPQIFSLLVSQTTDVDATATVVLGPVLPQARILTIADLTVSDFDPAQATIAGGQPITITGTGFLSPVSVTIDGTVCPGAAVVATGQITGLTVPPGTGSNLAIVLTCGTLPPLTLTQTFSYGTPGGGSSGVSPGGSCSASAASVAILPVFALVALRRRRKTRPTMRAAANEA